MSSGKTYSFSGLRGAVDEQVGTVLVVPRQLAQKFPPACRIGRISAAVLKLLASPKNGPFRTRIEAFRIKQRALVVIAQKADFALHHQVDALARIGTVTHDVTQTKDLLHALFADVAKDRAKGFQIAVNIADQRSFHVNKLSVPRVFCGRRGGKPRGSQIVSGHCIDLTYCCRLGGASREEPFQTSVTNAMLKHNLPLKHSLLPPKTAKHERQLVHTTTIEGYVRILALETSGTAGSVAALSDLDLLAEFKLPADRGRHQTLAPAMQMVLARAGWRPSQVELVSVTAGPGSFTGLRVGVTTAKVFAYCNKAAILGLDTLEVIAFAVPAEIRRVSVALDAQRGQVTARDFSRNDDGGLSPMGPPRLVDWTAWLSALPAEVSITGPLLRRFAHRLPRGPSGAAARVLVSHSVRGRPACCPAVCVGPAGRRLVTRPRLFPQERGGGEVGKSSRKEAVTIDFRLPLGLVPAQDVSPSTPRPVQPVGPCPPRSSANRCGGSEHHRDGPPTRVRSSVARRLGWAPGAEFHLPQEVPLLGQGARLPCGTAGLFAAGGRAIDPPLARQSGGTWSVCRRTRRATPVWACGFRAHGKYRRGGHEGRR